MSEDKLWVLIVDDEEAIREGLAEWLARSEGMTVDTVASGEEALTLIQEAEGAYDAVLLDEVLPGIQGIETLERIKAKFPNIQVIMFTGKSPDSGIEALRKGAYRYLMKPPNNEELAYLLRHIGEIREMERELAQERLRRQREEKLRAFPAPVSLAFEFDQVAQKILNDLQEVVEYRKASLQLVRDDMRMLLAGAGFDEHKIDRWLLRPVSQDPLITRVVRGQEPLILSHTAQDPDWQQSAATFNVNSWVGLPLVHNQEVVGLITMDHDRPGFYTEKIKEKLLAFARQMALDVLRMRFFDNAQRRIRDLEILNSVEQIIGTKLDTDSLLATIAEQIVEHLDCTHCTLFFQEKVDAQTLLVPRVTKGERAEKIMKRSFKAGEGLAGWVFESGKSYISADVRDDLHFARATDPRDQPRSMLVVPIQVGDRTIGVISADQDAYGWFSQSDLRLVETLARQAGVAIERAEGLRVVRDIGNEVISIQEVDEILRHIVLGAIRLTHTVTGVIYLFSEDKESIKKSFVHPPDFDRPPPRMKGEGGLTRKIIETGAIQEIPDIYEEEGTNPQLLELWFRSMIGVPLKLENRVIGVLYLNDDKPRHFTETEQVLLATLAGQAAIAIQNARRFEQLVMLHQTSQSLLALESQQSTHDVLRAIAEDSLSALRADLVDIYEYQQEQNRFINLPQVTAGERRGGFVGTQKVYEDDAIFQLIKKSEAVYIQDARRYPPFVATHRLEFENQPKRRFVFREKVLSCAVVPLRVEDETVGLLFVNYRTAQEFTAEESRLIEVFANYAAIAIRNARRIEQLGKALKQSEDRRAELEAFSSIGETLADLELES